MCGGVGVALALHHLLSHDFIGKKLLLTLPLLSTVCPLADRIPEDLFPGPIYFAFLNCTQNKAASKKVDMKADVWMVFIHRSGGRVRRALEEIMPRETK